MRQTATLSGLWLALIGVLLGVFVFDLDEWAEEKYSQIRVALKPNECAGLPEPYLGRCQRIQTYLGKSLSTIEDVNQSRIYVYNSPIMQGFPENWDNEWLEDSVNGLLKGAQFVGSGIGGFSIDVRKGEFAAVDLSAIWAYFEFKYSCSTSAPRAIAYSFRGQALDDVTIYNFAEAAYEDAVKEWVNLPIDLTIQPWPDMAALKAFQEEGRAYDKAAMEKDPSIKRWRDIEFLETPRSLSDETGIDQIVTYAFRISFINQAGEVEVSSTNRVIVLPYKEGNLELVSMVTRLNDEKPDPKSWQHVWRNMRFDDGPPKAQPFVDDDGQTHQGQSLANFIYQNSTCEEAHKLPPRWAWPKDLPRYWEE